MTQTEYEQKKRECLLDFCKEHCYDIDPDVSGIFGYAFDRAYALGKQEIKQEIKQETDAEGEEMLRASRMQVQEMYAANERIKADFAGKETAHYSEHINHVLRHLFGSRCLPDAPSSEHKTTKSKFRVGDQVLYKDSEIVRVIDGTVGSDNYYIQGQCNCIPASDLKPYIESADLNTDRPTCTDLCSSKIDERRLNIDGKS